MEHYKIEVEGGDAGFSLYDVEPLRLELMQSQAFAVTSHRGYQHLPQESPMFISLLKSWL